AKPCPSMVFGLESLAQVVDSSMDGVAALSQAGRIIYANSAAGGVLGVSSESIVGTDFLAYVLPEDRPRLGPYFADIALRRPGQLRARPTRPGGDGRDLAGADPFCAARCGPGGGA